MSLSVAARTIQDRRRALVGWSIALVVLVGFTLAFYPSIKGNDSYDDLLKDMPEALQTFVGTLDMTSPAGYLESQFFIFMLPLLFLIFAIGRGADAIAGEERRKTLDLLLANPVSRGRVVLEKFAALVASTAIIAGVLVVVLILGASLVSMDISARELVVPTVGTTLLGILFGTVALAAGAVVGKKGVATGAAALVAVVTYFLNSLAPVVDALEPLRVLSPFYWALGGSPVGDPVSIVRLTYVAVAIVVVLVAGIIGFDRRDLST